MLFNSLQFAIFLPIVFIVYWALPDRCRWPLLLAASYYFYMSWNVRYVVLILFTTAVSYTSALLLERTENAKKKKTILAAALISCLGILFTFKYFDFFSESFSKAAGFFGMRLHPVTLKLLLPVGISFYTFQTLSYVIDVYKGEVRAERNFGIYAAFISFFPQLVAGPIERTGNLLPQIKKGHVFDSGKVLYGVKLMLWGYYKKIVIADNISAYVDRVFGHLPDYRGFALAIAVFLFAIQIYCDFSGYSDIARGAAGILDIDLVQNFRAPYFSASIREFWSRWHISLSTWFRDYVYIPLGGNRVKPFRHYCNLIVTFLVSGLWHGASWTFVLWGGVHGIAQAAEAALRIHTPQRRNIVWALRVVLVFCFTTAAWVLFRAQTVSDAAYVFGHLFTGVTDPVHYLSKGLSAIGITKGHLAFLAAACFLPLAAVDHMGSRCDGDGIAAVEKWRAPARWLFYIVLGLVIIFFSQKELAAEFVYFQF